MTEAVKLDTEEMVEAAEQAIRDNLGLRPVNYRSQDKKGGHPDQRPCPPWCWVGQGSEYDHEITAAHPMDAEHHYEMRIPVVASHYPGKIFPRDEVEPATVECYLLQTGQDAPRIEVRPRDRGPDVKPGSELLLTLAVTDA